MSESERLLARAERLVPAWTQTLSKNPTQWLRGIAPAYVTRAEGAHVFGVDGREYIDFPMALGPVILGHTDPRVTAAIERQLRDGITYTLPHPSELDVAQRIVDRVPGAEMVRFGKTGSDATSAAVRLARAVTGRDHVLAAGYHGWHDWYVATTTRDLGVPRAVAELTGTFTYNDLASLDAALAAQGGDTAAVVLEPSGAERPAPGFLEGVIERAHAAGALVVFDEVITGFRLGPGGAQERYGVTADLVAFGKALGNGMPISALAGRAELMELLAEVFFSGTHGGEALSLAAAGATLDALDDAAYAQLYDMGETLRAAVLASIKTYNLSDWVTIDGEAPRTLVAIREPGDPVDGLVAKSLVQQELLRRGVLFNTNNFICLAHSDEDIATAAAAYDAALARLADGLTDGAGGVRALLEAEPLAPAFRPVR
ncbi:aspartate aminotransferase family protein [Baekduia sp. Peel2402]|uniref:aspartate aminotransferase family protein n=1 Tax=Baekduia sp. Peel2402 TaxID=3458296 RepID=UPI00403E6030